MGLKLKKLSFLFVFSFLLIMAGCEKESNDIDIKSSGSDKLSTAVIPSDFDWSSTKQISINLNVNSSAEKSSYSVEIFDKNPSNSDAKSLYKINASLDKDYTTVMTISKAVTSVYIQKTYPSGQTSITSEKIDGDILTVDFTDLTSSVKSSSLFKTKSGDEDSYPITETDGGTYTYLFEDCWPKMGDYDMNDLVMDIQGITYGISTDDEGLTWVNSIDYTVALRAAGGAYELGAGIQFDEITPSAIFYASINKYLKHSDIKPSFLTGEIFTNSSKQLEEGQTKAVVPICDEIHQALGSQNMTNTIVGENTADTLQIKFHIGFNASRLPLRENVGIENFNVFIVVNNSVDYGNNSNGYKMRKEIHMAGYALTDLGTDSLFGTESDNSTEQLFKSKNGLMWGLVVPGPVDYPLEYKEITKVYPNFKSWATSGGTTDTDWYDHSASEFIY